MSNHDNIDTPMNGGDDSWAGGNRDGGGTPPRRGGSPGARRSSRSRSPKRNGGGEDKQNGTDGSSNPGNNLHVSGLSSRVDSRELEAIFSKIGKVKKASVMYDPHTRDSRGFGFVTMETPEDAEAVVQQLNATEHFGKIINVEKARRGRARTPTPGRYYGPPKRPDRRNERPYDPRPYDSRYSERDRDRGYGGGGGRYEDRRSSRYDDRRYDDRRYDERRYEDRRYEDRRY